MKTITAIYYNPEGQPPVQLSVLRTNGDGTVDLGRVVDKKPVVVIGRCRVSETPQAGQCVLDVEPAAVKPVDPKAPAAGDNPPQS